MHGVVETSQRCGGYILGFRVDPADQLQAALLLCMRDALPDVRQSAYALVGDLISSGILLGGLLLTGKAKKPPFEENPDAVSDALVSLVSLGAEMFYMGHGGPLPQDEVLRHARRIAAPETAQAVSTGSSRAGPQGLQGMLKG